MTYREHGFVLMLTLVLLQVISMIWLLAMLEVTLSLQPARHFWLRREAVRTADAVLTGLEAKVMMSLPVCIVSVMPAAELSAKSDSWWRKSACVLKSADSEYYYVVEAFGPDACAVVNGNTAEYYRLTLLSIPKVPKGSRIVLQSTLAMPATDTDICNDSRHYVRLGRQMVREI